MTNVTLPRAELQAALDIMEVTHFAVADGVPHTVVMKHVEVIETLRARLAVDVCAEKQPDVEKTSQRVEKTAQRVEKTAQQGEKPEPVAWYDREHGETETVWSRQQPPWEGEWKPLYTAPPQRPWQGLTDEEIHWADCVSDADDCKQILEFARAIEAKLKEKNK